MQPGWRPLYRGWLATYAITHNQLLLREVLARGGDAATRQRAGELGLSKSRGSRLHGQSLKLLRSRLSKMTGQSQLSGIAA